VPTTHRPAALAFAAAVTLALLTRGAPSAGAQALAAPQGLPSGVVVCVVDGDTADVRSPAGAVERVRLVGLDTPETVDPRKPVQCFGQEAAGRARELLEGQAVTLESDPGQGARDKYGRQLAYLWLPDGRNAAEVLIAEGYGFEYTYRLPHKYQEPFRAAQEAARAAGAGLWAPETCAGQAAPADLADGVQLPDFAYAGPYAPTGPDRDCGDFRTWQEAQAFFLAAGGPERDPHRLDSDTGGFKGIACESLPGAPR
jgi:endonuclease YncB( thermonuclease family)